jgi:hypothetical protein
VRAFYWSQLRRKTFEGSITENGDGSGEFVADEDWRCGIHLPLESMEELRREGSSGYIVALKDGDG